jgi:hypothetical protein
MRDHHRLRAQVADREGAHGAARNINGRDGVAQKLVGGFVLKGYPVKRPPLNVGAEGFDQRTGGEDLAMLVENERREAKRRERFAGDARPLELQPRRHQGAAGEMGTQFIQFSDGLAFERSAFGPSPPQQYHIFARGNRDRRCDTTADAVRTPHLTED